MLLSPSNSLEGFITLNLAARNLTAKELLKTHYLSRGIVTLQAVYKALKKLVGQGIVLKYKDTYSLNNVWKRDVISLLEQGETFPQLNPGESITYSFKSLSQLDAYWKHIQESSLGEIAVTYFYCPHQYWWFVPGRRESEIHFYKQFAEEKRQAVLLLGGTTAVDKQMRDIIANPYVQVHTEVERSFRAGDNLTVKNDIIIRTRLPLAISTRINEVFERNLSMQETEEQLSKLFSKRISVKIQIEKNAKKAEKLTRQIGKYFYIKREVTR
ncbi:MAG: hypothetical protein WC217_03215 [Candidatus Paceibacterota bacterium]|jgi:hypothetical protein